MENKGYRFIEVKGILYIPFESPTEEGKVHGMSRYSGYDLLNWNDGSNFNFGNIFT